MSILLNVIENVETHISLISKIQLHSISVSNPLSILELIADPPLVSNCSKLELTCRISSNSYSNLNIWWTLRNENISTISDIIESYMPSTNQSKLTIECATFQHQGSYACNVQQINESELIYRKETNVKIFSEYSIQVIPLKSLF